MTMKDVAIRVENLSKQYRIGQLSTVGSFRKNFADRMSGASQASSEGSTEGKTRIWALKNISLEVEQGEVLGIIGKNGSGKSTFLKILSRVTGPTCGRVELHGRLGSLLEVGTGFHPELTGRENVYLNGAILGMKRAEIQRKFDEIVAFAEVESFIDTPVKHYSSGMYVRLAFAVASHCDPQILLVDEILAVGDEAFRRKCNAHLEKLQELGRTILLVTHSLPMALNLCTRAALLDAGRLIAVGDPRETIDDYMHRGEAGGPVPLSSRSQRGGDGRARCTGLMVVPSRGPSTDVLRAGEPILVRLTVQGPVSVPGVDLRIGVYTAAGEHVAHLSSRAARAELAFESPDTTYECTILQPNLLHGNYRLNVALLSSEDGAVMDHVVDAGEFSIHPRRGWNAAQEAAKGCCYFTTDWRTESREVSVE